MLSQNQVTEISNRIITTLENTFRKLKSDRGFQKVVDELNNFYNDEAGMSRTDFVLDDDELYHSQYYGYGNKAPKTYTGCLYLRDEGEDVGQLYLEGSCEEVGSTTEKYEAYFALGRNMNKQKALYIDYKAELAITSRVLAYMSVILNIEARKQKLVLKSRKSGVGFSTGSNNDIVFEVSLNKSVKLAEDTTTKTQRQNRLENILEKYNTINKEE